MHSNVHLQNNLEKRFFSLEAMGAESEKKKKRKIILSMHLDKMLRYLYLW